MAFFLCGNYIALGLNDDHTAFWLAENIFCDIKEDIAENIFYDIKEDILYVNN